MKKMSKGMLMTALICGAVYLGGSPVYASELQEFSLDEYVVTAARTETKLVDTPANISVVDAQTIEERHYKDVSEVLKDVPGANVLDSGTGAYEKSIMINGDERVLILVDGRRLNFDMGTMTRSGYDMNQLPNVALIERIEVLKGAGGALYGSDAVGGVINIITKKADRDYGKVSVGYGSMGAKDYNAMYSFKEGKTGVSVAASKYEQDYYKYRDAKSDTTKRWLGDSEFKNEKVSLDINQELKENSYLNFGYEYSKFEGFNASDVSEFGVPIDKETQNAYAKYNWILNGHNDGYIQFYHNELEYNNYGNMKEKTNGLDLQQVITISNNNKVVIGGTYRKSDVKNVTNNYDESIDNIALFVNDTWEFVPTWTINFGMRYDDHSEAGDETTLSAGLNKKINDYSHAYINWGQVFKAPTTDDLFYYSEPYMGMWGMYGNKNLKPETGDTWSIGYNTRLGENTDIGINYFESDINNAIEWIKDSLENYYVVNFDNQKRKGFELSVDHNFNDNLSVTASYSYIQRKNSGPNGELRDYNYIPNTYRLGVKYRDGKWNTNVWLRAGSGASTNYEKAYSYGSTYDRISYVDSSYITVDMAITYSATKDLSFYAKAYNLFNEAYAEMGGVNNGSYKYPAQSRRFIVGAEYKF